MGEYSSAHRHQGFSDATHRPGNAGAVGGGEDNNAAIASVEFYRSRARHLRAAAAASRFPDISDKLRELAKAYEVLAVYVKGEDRSNPPG
jgi:hypothetical protein